MRWLPSSALADPSWLGYLRRMRDCRALALVLGLFACGDGDGASAVATPPPPASAALSGVWEVVGPQGTIEGTISISPTQWVVDFDGFDLTATRDGDIVVAAIEQTAHCHPYESGCGPAINCGEDYEGRGCRSHTEYQNDVVVLARSAAGVDSLGGLPLPLGGVWSASPLLVGAPCSTDASCAEHGYDPPRSCLNGACVRVRDERPSCTSSFDGETLAVECTSVNGATADWLTPPGTGSFRATRSRSATSVFGALGGEWRIERSVGGECRLLVEGRRVEGSCAGTPDRIDGSFWFELDASLSMLSGQTHRGVEFSARRR